VSLLNGKGQEEYRKIRPTLNLIIGSLGSYGRINFSNIPGTAREVREISGVGQTVDLQDSGRFHHYQLQPTVATEIKLSFLAEEHQHGEAGAQSDRVGQTRLQARQRKRKGVRNDADLRRWGKSLRQLAQAACPLQE